MVKMKIFGLLIFVALLFVVGITGLFFPHRIQALAMRAVSCGLTLKIDAISNNAISTFIRSRGYLGNVRAVGALSLLGCAFLLWMFIKNL